MSLVGLRVLRGPDWSHGDIDGGDGHIGTIVNVGGLNTADVVWDNGQQCVCRIGENGQHDLRIFDSGPVGIRHTQFVCSSCSERGIFGMRWKCKQCDDINLCPVCYVTDKHNINHQYLRFDTPQSQGVETPKRSAGVRCQAMGIFPGATVKRGKDWKGGNQDGGEGNTGEVISIDNNEESSSVRNMVKVKWNSTGKTSSYRLGGIDGKVDLMFVEQSRGLYYYRDHLPVCVKPKKVNVNRGPSSTSRGQGVSGGSQSDVLKEGDQVCITVSAADLQKLQEEHSGFTKAMLNCRGKVGEIKGFAQDGDAFVEFDGLKFRLYPGVLKKVYKFKSGDVVRIINDEETVKNLQDDHGGYIKQMKQYLGKVGNVSKIDSDGDVRVKFGRREFAFNPLCCFPAPGEKVYDANDEEDDPDSDSDVDLSDLNNTFRLLLGGMTELGSLVSIQTLYKAITNGDTSMVRSVLKSNTSLADTSFKGVTPLILASHQGHKEIVLELLSKGCDIDKVDHNGNTALIAAVIGKENAIGKLLIEKGADVTPVNNNGSSALHAAAMHDYGDLIELLLRRGCNPNFQESDGDTALHNAISTKSNSAVSMICRSASLNLSIMNKNGFNVLHLAAKNDNFHAVEKILDRDKSIVKSRKPDGFTALHLAAFNDNEKSAQILVEKGKADINSKTLEGDTPLHLASMEGYIDLVEFLVDKNADIHAVNSDRYTPLHKCCEGRELGGNSTHQLMATLMGLSAQSSVQRRIRVARFLIQKGAKTDVKNSKGKTPVDCCKDGDFKRVVTGFVEQRSGSPFSSSGFRGISLPCRRCGTSPASITLLPCDHKCVCRDCALQVNRCPICHQFILKRVDKGGDPECHMQ